MLNDNENEKPTLLINPEIETISTIRTEMTAAVQQLCAALNLANTKGLKVEWAYAPNEYGKLELKLIKIFKEV